MLLAFSVFVLWPALLIAAPAAARFAERHRCLVMLALGETNEMPESAKGLR